MPYLPSISIITPTLDNQHEIAKFLASIRAQAYPQKKIEILFVDGGSTDKTLKIAKKNGVKVIKNPFVLAEPGVAIGMEKAKGDLKIVLATDNIFKDRQAFRKIVKVFENETVYAAFPKQNYTSSDNLFTKYHNTFTDPLNHFVQGDASNARTFHRIYKTIIQSKLYDVFDFGSSKVIPMISFSQGFTVRGDFRRKKSDMFDDNAPVIDLIERGKKIAYIHDLSIYHHTIIDYKHFIKKQRWATQNFLEKKNYGIAHRYNKLSKVQKIKIMLWPFYAFSFVLPLLHAIYGAVRDREPIWLFHPIDCSLCAYANLIQVLEYTKSKILKKSSQILRQ